MSNRYLVTGAAGFIGAAVSSKLLEQGHEVLGIDNLNDYYEVELKEARLKNLRSKPGFAFRETDISDHQAVDDAFEEFKPDLVCHLAAQAGVRYSIDHPEVYVQSNLVGSFNIFEAAKKRDLKHVVYASSSSVYGNAETAPFTESQDTNHPISFYASTKKANEVMAFTYYHLYGMNMTGLRFFTVYGPWGRPDMAPIKFAKLITNDQPIDVYNHGKMRRDFTYIDDIVDGVLLALSKPLGYEVINLGGSQVAELETFIDLLEKNLGKKAEKNYLPLQPGDVLLTSADTSKARELLGWKPQVSLEEGVKRFVEWFKEYYGKP